MFVWLSVPMLRAQIFTLQSAEPLKINLSLSDKDSDQAGERADTDKRAGRTEGGGGGEGREEKKKKK